jgi:hypothetical protein
MPPIGTATESQRIATLDAIEGALAEWEQRRPDAFALATVASLARSIESELLRALRVELKLSAGGVPVTVSAESGIWFSDFVESRGADGITLLPEVLQALRPRLKEDPTLLKDARRIIEVAHESAPEVLRWEERLVYLALTGEASLLEQEALRGVRSISKGTRQLLVTWIDEMWPRLPVEATSNVLMGKLRQLATGLMRRRMPNHAGIPSEPEDLILDFSSIPTREIGIALRNSRFVLGDVREAKFGIQVPDLEPVEIDILSPSELATTQPLVIPRNGEAEFDASKGPLWIRTLAGQIHHIDPTQLEDSLPLLIQVLATFMSTDGVILEEDIDSSLDFLRHDYPEASYSELRQLFRQTLYEQQNLAVMAQTVGAQLSPERKFMLGVQLYDVISRAGLKQERVVALYSFMSQIGMATELIDIVYKINASNESDPSIYEHGASPLESLSFAAEGKANIVLKSLAETDRLMAFRYHDLILLKNYSGQNVSVGGRLLARGGFCRIYPGQRILIGDQVLSYQELAQYFDAKKNVSLPENDSAKSVPPVIESEAGIETTQKQGNVRFVYLAECTPDMDDARDQMKVFLQALGWIVLPAEEYPENEYRSAMENDLKESHAFVQLLGPYPWKEGGFDRIQNDSASAHGIPRFRYRSSEIDLAKVDAEQREFLSAPDIRVTDFQHFKAHLKKELAVLAQRRNARRTITATTTSTPHIVVAICSANPDPLWDRIYGWIYDREEIDVSLLMPGESLEAKHRAEPCHGFLVGCDAGSLKGGPYSPREYLQQCLQIQLQERNAARRPPVALVYWSPPAAIWSRLLPTTPLKVHRILGDNPTNLGEFFDEVRQVAQSEVRHRDMTLGTSYNIFRLLVPAKDTMPPNTPTIELDGALWTTTDDSPLIDGIVPDYTCISYSWGSGRIRNPMAPDRQMSDRVVPVIETAIRALRPAAIWVDAFCMPAHEPERTACLRSMGFLYASAKQVIAVLSKSSVALLEEVARTESLDEPGLLMLEKDEWVSRAWTYQEIVNSKSFLFAAEGGSVSFSGSEFLNRVGHALSEYKKRHSFDSFTLRTVHPRLDSLEDTIADWMTANYEKRTAYQAMSCMDRRTYATKDDYFNALIGAITAEPLRDTDATALHPVEYFMRVCEEKGDFSFIYSSAPRSNTPGRSWRPLAGLMPAIQPWHSFGDGQSGHLYPGYLRLDNMCRLTRGAVSSTADQFLTEWLSAGSGDSAHGNIPDQILARLRQAGFAGSGDFVELEEGYFFPLTRNPMANDLQIFVAAGVRWVHGGPGLITTQEDAGVRQFRDVGVFVGPHPKSYESIDLA